MRSFKHVNVLPRPQKKLSRQDSLHLNTCIAYKAIYKIFCTDRMSGWVHDVKLVFLTNCYEISASFFPLFAQLNGQTYIKVVMLTNDFILREGFAKWTEFVFPIFVILYKSGTKWSPNRIFYTPYVIVQ